ncbi:hypothetical protein R6Q59_033591 [Mikania micrantha]
MVKAPRLKEKKNPWNMVSFQAIRALGNITSISIAYRDLILRASGLDSLIAQFQRNNPAKYSMMRLVARGLSRFCAGKPPTQEALPAFTCLLASNDSEILLDACLELTDHSYGKSLTVQVFINARLCGYLVKLLRHSYLSTSHVLPVVTNLLRGASSEQIR